MSSTPPGGARPGVLAAFLLVAACAEPPRLTTELQLIETSRARVISSPLLVASQGREFVLSAASNGMLAAIDQAALDICVPGLNLIFKSLASSFNL